MKILIEKLQSLSTILDSLSDLSELEPSESDYLIHLISELGEHQHRLLKRAGKDVTSNDFNAHNAVMGAASSGSDGTENNTNTHLSAPDENFFTEPESVDQAQFLQRALEELACGRFDEARSILETAIQVHPFDAELLNHLGLAHWELGNMEDAASAYDEAMGAACPDEFSMSEWIAQPNHPFLRSMEGRALALNQLQRYDESIPLFETLFNLNPKRYAGCIYLAGESYHLTGDLDKALKCYLRSPKEPCVLYNLALIHHEMGDNSESASIFLEAFAQNPHIAAKFIGTSSQLLGSAPGYLKTSNYAQDFVSVCADLWQDLSVLDFMKQLFEHPLVQAHLNSLPIYDEVYTSHTSHSVNTFKAKSDAEDQAVIGKIVDQVLSSFTKS